MGLKNESDEFWIEAEAKRIEVYHRLCPYAVKDLPIEKSTTQQAFLEGVKWAVEKMKEELAEVKDELEWYKGNEGNERC